MPISHDTLRLADHLRIRVDRQVDDTTRTLVQAWARAWEQVNVEWANAISELVDIGDGKWPTRRQIARATRAQQALALTYNHVVRLAELAGVTVATSARNVTSETAFWQARIIASQLPTEVGHATVAARLDRVDPAALEWIVDRTTQQVTALHKPLTDDMTEGMKRALVRGVAVGDNPKKVAAEMLRRLEHKFNGGLTRALIITRTEMLDAHRAAAHAQQMANADVLVGWYWLAKLDRRTCPSCWAQHGTFHELDEPGPLDHQQGRCTRLPKLKTWEDLGFDGIDEPDDDLVDARAAFDALPLEDQLAIMGRKRLAGLNAGLIGWDDLSVRHSTDGWRDSYRVATIGGLNNFTTTPGGGLGSGGGIPPVLEPSGGGGRYNLGDTLLVDQMQDDNAKAAVQRAVDVIASVHGVDAVMPDLQVIEFSSPAVGGRQELGEFTYEAFGTDHYYDRFGRAGNLRVNVDDDGLVSTLIHELGHFLDLKGLGDPDHFASGLGAAAYLGESIGDPLLQPFIDAVVNSPQRKTLVRMLGAHLRGLPFALLQAKDTGDLLPWEMSLDWVDYAMDPREFFGRAYAQWVALRSGDAVLLEEVLASARSPIIGDRWELLAGEWPTHPGQWPGADFDPIAKALDDLFATLGLLRKAP